MAQVVARAEFLWDGWIQHEHRWELVPLVAFAWQWLARGAAEGAYLANQAFGPLRNLGKFAEAEQLLQRALAVDERSFGLNHPNVATCLNNLAALLLDTNRIEEAESLYRRALEIDERSFGADDPKVATCLNNLAQLHQATGRLQEAESLYRRALAIDEQGFGAVDHESPSTLTISCSRQPIGWAKPSRSTDEPWPLTSNASARTIQESPATSTTWRSCSKPSIGQTKPKCFISAHLPSTS